MVNKPTLARDMTDAALEAANKVVRVALSRFPALACLLCVRYDRSIEASDVLRHLTLHRAIYPIVERDKTINLLTGSTATGVEPLRSSSRPLLMSVIPVLKAKPCAST